jgi:hypothetical protein
MQQARATRHEVAAARQAPKVVPDPPDGAQLADLTDDDVGLAADLFSLTNEARASSRTGSWPAWLTPPSAGT